MMAYCAVVADFGGKVQPISSSNCAKSIELASIRRNDTIGMLFDWRQHRCRI